MTCIRLEDPAPGIRRYAYLDSNTGRWLSVVDLPGPLYWRA